MTSRNAGETTANRKRSKLPHSPIFAPTTIWSTVCPRYESEVKQLLLAFTEDRWASHTDIVLDFQHNLLEQQVPKVEILFHLFLTACSCSGFNTIPLVPTSQLAYDTANSESLAISDHSQDGSGSLPGWCHCSIVSFPDDTKGEVLVTSCWFLRFI